MRPALRIALVFATTVLGISVTAVSAGRYVPTTSKYIKRNYSYSLSVRVPGSAVWAGGPDFETWAIVTVSTNIYLEELYEGDPNWCEQPLIWRKCPRHGQGEARAYGGPHTVNERITCTTTNCMGHAWHPKPPCDWMFSPSSLYWGETWVYRSKNANNVNYFDPGPTERVGGCREEPFTKYDYCHGGMIISGECCYEPVSIGDGIYICFDDL